MPMVGAHGTGAASLWVQRWAHLVKPGGKVLDLACGHGRHMKFFAALGHPVTGVDNSAQAVAAASQFGKALLADVENGPWPLSLPLSLPLSSGDSGGTFPITQFDAVLVTNYLWRPLFPIILQSLADQGVLIYETFSVGNETVGKPSRADFLLQNGELLTAFSGLRIVAFEHGFEEDPPRFVQRLVAVNEAAAGARAPVPARYRL